MPHKILGFLARNKTQSNEGIQPGNPNNFVHCTAEKNTNKNSKVNIHSIVHVCEPDPGDYLYLYYLVYTFTLFCNIK